MKLLRAIRFDDSDTRVFERAAEPGEWLVSGAGLFFGIEKAQLKGRLRQAFANGFLGCETLGHATFGTVATADEPVAATIRAQLVKHFMQEFGAPGHAEAESVASDEIAFMMETCAPLEVGALLTVRRTLAADGNIAEEFRVLARRVGVQHTMGLWRADDDGA
ncbi:MAG: DUF6505 family protein [Hyphomicrobiaceae bacterium]